MTGAIKNASSLLQSYAKTRVRFDKVAKLVEGFESPFGLELLATVHWVMKNEHVVSIQDIVEKVYEWNQKKKQFTPRQIELAVHELRNKGWFL